MVVAADIQNGNKYGSFMLKFYNPLFLSSSERILEACDHGYSFEVV